MNLIILGNGLRNIANNIYFDSIAIDPYYDLTKIDKVILDTSDLLRSIGHKEKKKKQ